MADKKLCFSFRIAKEMSKRLHITCRDVREGVLAGMRKNHGSYEKATAVEQHRAELHSHLR
jgi:hypothetical protein